MRVLFITNMYPVPDYIYFGIHVKEQIEALENTGKLESEIYFINGRESKSNYLKSITDIKRIVENGKFDLIHIHYGLSALFLLFYKPSIPVVVTLHSGELFQKRGYISHIIQKNITLAVVKKVDRVVVLNDDMIALLKQHKNKLVKLPCGTDTSFFKEQDEQKDEKKYLIGFPGNQQRKEKNFPLFSAIISQLKTDKPVEVIEFHSLTRKDVLMNLNKMDLLLMTSTVEGSPQIIKEAMACNKPIVSTAVGDVAYLLNNVSNCHVINSFEADKFTAAVNSILDLPPAERKSNGRDQLSKIGLDADSVANELYKLYKELV